MAGEHILVVDDDRVILQLCEVALTEVFGYAVTTAPSGFVAIEAVMAGTAFDLVLMDIMMKGMNGFEAAAEILALQPSLPVLFMSAHTHRSEYGDQIDIEKPFGLDELNAAIRSRLDQ